MQEHQEKKNEYQLKEQKIQSHIEGIQKEKLKGTSEQQSIFRGAHKRLCFACRLINI